MDQSIQELINSLNDTIEKLENENLALKQQINSINTKTESAKANSDSDDDVTNKQVSDSDEMIVANENADLIIMKAIDFAIDIKNDITILLNKMEKYSNSPQIIFSAIEHFIHKNKNLYNFSSNDPAELAPFIKDSIFQKISKSDK